MDYRFFKRTFFLLTINYIMLSGRIIICLDLSNVKIDRYDMGETIVYECKKFSVRCPDIVAEYTKVSPPVYSVYMRMNTVVEEKHSITDPPAQTLFAHIEHAYYFQKLLDK